MSDDFLIKEGRFFKAKKPRLTPDEARDHEAQFRSALEQNNYNRPGKTLRFGWVNDPAHPYWRIEARGIIAKDGSEIIRRFWIRKGRELGTRKVVVGPSNWADPGYTVSGVVIPDDVDLSSWNIDDIISYIDTTFPMKMTRSDIDRVKVYQETYQLVWGRNGRYAKTTIQQAIIQIYFGWREAWIQLERDPQNFDEFCEACGYHPPIMKALLTGKAKRKNFNLDVLHRIALHMSWFMVKYNGPVIILETRPDFVTIPIWVWPDPEMNETTEDVIYSAKMRHQSTHDQGHWVRWPNRYRSYWTGRGAAGSNLPHGGESDIRPAVTWQTNLGAAGEFQFVQVRPEVEVQTRIREPTEWEDIKKEDFTRVVREVMEAGAFDEKEFADAVGTSPQWLKRLWAGKEQLKVAELRVWFRHLKPYYCPQPELKTIRNGFYKWRLHPYERDTT